METIKKVLNELYKAVDTEDALEAQDYVDNAIDLLSDDDTDYGNHMAHEELLGVISNLSGGAVEDCIYELEVMVSEIG